MTAKQKRVLAALAARPDYWITEAYDIAAAAGLSDHGTTRVLYHLKDAGVVEYGENGWYVREQRA